MKKILILLIVMFLFVAGCESENEKLKPVVWEDTSWGSLEEQQELLDSLERPHEFDIE